MQDELKNELLSISYSIDIIITLDGNPFYGLRHWIDVDSPWRVANLELWDQISELEQSGLDSFQIIRRLAPDASKEYQRWHDLPVVRELINDMKKDVFISNVSLIEEAITSDVIVEWFLSNSFAAWKLAELARDMWKVRQAFFKIDHGNSSQFQLGRYRDLPDLDYLDKIKWWLSIVTGDKTIAEDRYEPTPTITTNPDRDKWILETYHKLKSYEKTKNALLEKIESGNCDWKSITTYRGIKSVIDKFK